MPAQQEDLSQYRVLGKPLSESSNIQTSVLEENVEKNLNVTSENQELENEVLLADEAAARLKAAFDLAVAETENKDFSSQEIEKNQSSEEQTRLAIELLPAKTQVAIGTLTYQAHIYASLEHKRWIKINGVELYEGDKINGMRLLEIAPESSVFRFQGYDFTVKAMQDWQP
jgi:general secretion pathway protein B